MSFDVYYVTGEISGTRFKNFLDSMSLSWLLLYKPELFTWRIRMFRWIFEKFMIRIALAYYSTRWDWFIIFLLLILNDILTSRRYVNLWDDSDTKILFGKNLYASLYKNDYIATVLLFIIPCRAIYIARYFSTRIWKLIGSVVNWQILNGNGR